MVGDASTQRAYSDAVVTIVARILADRLCGHRRPCLVGVSGLQGSGKSTLVAQLTDALSASSVRTLAMSLDDFYFGRGERQRLARTIHPLFATRGVPGTHDLDLIAQTLDGLRDANAHRPARVPRFDKGRDTRMRKSRWHVVCEPPQVILFEGWCVGVPAQSEQTLRRPLNTLERDEDPDARWRGRVNAELRDGYAALWRRFDALMMLQAPNFEVVQRWRDEQEAALRRTGAPRAMSPAQLHRFIMHYERLSRQALRTLPARADVRIVLDANRAVRRIVEQAWGSA